jgi:uncharacterized membrane protein
MAKEKIAREQAAPAKSEASEGMGCAILAYLLIGIIWYFADEKMKKNNFVKFHVKQALVLLIVSIIISVVFSILGFILIWIPVIGWVLLSILWVAYGIGSFVLWLIGIIAAATSKQKVLPVIGQFANKLTF